LEPNLRPGRRTLSRKFVDDFYKKAIPAIVRAIRFAIEQPADVDVNQIVVRPTVQEF